MFGCTQKKIYLLSKNATQSEGQIRSCILPDHFDTNLGICPETISCAGFL